MEIVDGGEEILNRRVRGGFAECAEGRSFVEAGFDCNCRAESGAEKKRGQDRVFRCKMVASTQHSRATPECSLALGGRKSCHVINVWEA
jgi:hypothetical protein